jgi:CheY-like chemotaxis protein
VTPPALAPAAPTEPPPAPCPNATVNGKHVHVLVAEDDRVTQRLVRHMLRRFGYNPHIVGTGRQAVAAIGSEHFDFILMDCFMPELDGFESCKTIRRLTSGTSVPSRHPTAALAEGGTRQRPYIIALTAQALPGDRERCYAAGMDDYVTKPIEPADLKDALMRGEAALDARDREAA